MTRSTAVSLDAVALAATWDGSRVWVATDGTLAGLDPDGADGDGARVRWDAPGRVTSLAASSDAGLVALVDPGVVAWLDRRAGDETSRRPLGGEPVLVGGGREPVFAVDVASERAWPVLGPGALGPPVPVPGVESAAVVRGAVWWLAGGDTVVRGNGMEVDLGPAADRRTALVGCGGSVWVGSGDALLRVGAYGGDTSPPLPAPFPPALLACGDGRLVGASREGVFVLDPSRDADARRVRLDVELDEQPALLVATRTAAWLFSATEPLARVVAYR